MAPEPAAVSGGPPVIQTPHGAVPSLGPNEWLRPEDRCVILSHGHWGPLTSGKTGVQVVRSGACSVVAVVEPDHVGRDAAQDWGIPGRDPVPTDASLGAVLAERGPISRVVVGIAPPGGRLPEPMRADIRLALEEGIPVLSGLHQFLADDPEFAPLAVQNGTPIVDLRRPPPDPVCANGIGRAVPVPIVATYGTDARSGKMTVCVALREAARRAGLRAAFVATGQTGMLLRPDAGAPIDRVISDFAAGEVERLVLQAARLDDDLRPTAVTPDLILVEGQGALSHPAFGAVTLAVLHGAWPDALVLCHVHDRHEKTMGTHGPAWPVLPVQTERALAEHMLEPLTGAGTAAVAIATPDLDDAAYQQVCRAHAHETDLPVVDVLRDDGADALLAAVLAHLKKGAKPVPQPAHSRV